MQRGALCLQRRRLTVALLSLLVVGCHHVKLIDQSRYYPRTDWRADLQYNTGEIHPLTMSPTGCPQLGVRLNGRPFQLVFDFGCGQGFQVTTAIKDRLDCQVLEDTHTYHADGRVRGTVQRIRVDSLEVCGARHDAQEGTLTNWRIFSSRPYEGLIGLEYFVGHRFTLDYRRHKLGLTKKPFPPALRGSKDYVVIEMPEPPGWHKYGVYVPGRVNGVDCTIHMDTGSSHTMIDPTLLVAAATPEKGDAKSPVKVLVSIGGVEFRIEDFRVAEIKHPSEYQHPVRMGIGSDLLRRFVITVDRTEDKNLLIIHR